MGSNVDIPYKWIAIVIVFLVFIFTFRDEISYVLRSTKEIKLDTSGITLRTSIGVTSVTASTTPIDTYFSLYPKSTYKTIRNGQFQYLISYPNNGRWIDVMQTSFAALIQTAQGFSMAVLVPEGDTFRSMVVLRIYYNPNVQIEGAMRGFMEAAGQGFSYKEPKYDYSTNSGTIEGFDSIENKITISRVILRNGYVFDLRAAFYPNEIPEIRAEINEIINSFNLL